jgi:hypothetical protein
METIMPGDNDTHLYGGPDEENRQTPTEGGFHGEAKAPPGDVPPDQTRRTMLGDGQSVTIEETSGVAAAEAAGNTGINR